mmetsp:Transcript_23589/g.51537  ORF Transcript_23589/g.51537 Transcript_23589/m.51537 type:complete len:228 (-) Transcript_23589:562-1245(-)
MASVVNLINSAETSTLAERKMYKTNGAKTGVHDGATRRKCGSRNTLSQAPSVRSSCFMPCKLTARHQFRSRVMPPKWRKALSRTYSASSTSKSKGHAAMLSRVSRTQPSLERLLTCMHCSAICVRFRAFDAKQLHEELVEVGEGLDAHGHGARELPFGVDVHGRHELDIALLAKGARLDVVHLVEMGHVLHVLGEPLVLWLDGLAADAARREKLDDNRLLAVVVGGL